MRNFSKSITFLTVFTLLINVFSVLLIMEPAKAAPGEARDTLSNNTTGAYSSHQISYEFVTTPEEGDTISITFPREFNCSGLTIGDVTTDNNWSVTAAGYIDDVCTINLLAGAGPGDISVTIADSITNPLNWGNYNINLIGSIEPSNWITFKVQIVSDSLDNYVKGGYSGHHVYYAFLGNPALDDTFTITLPGDFDCSILTTDHAYIEGSPGWSLTSAGPVDSTCQLVATATSVNPNHEIQVIFGYDEYMTNPINAGTYEVTLEGSYEPISPVYIAIPILTSIPTDITSSDLVGAKSSHHISFDFATAPAGGDTFRVVFPRFSGYGDERYHCSELVSGDFTLSNGWSVDSIDTATCTIIFSASSGASNPIDILISESHLLNPGFAWEGINISLLGSAELNPAPFIIHKFTMPGSGDGTDTMSNSNPSEYSSHNISYEFIYPADIFSLRTVTVTFPNGFDCTGILGTDIAEQPGWVFSIPTVDTCEILATPVDAVDDEHLIRTNPLIINIAGGIIQNPLSANYYNLSIVSSNYDGYYQGLYPAVSIPVTIGTPEGQVAGTGSDTMSNYTVGEYSVHQISYTFIEVVYTYDIFMATLPSEFDCTGLVEGDITIDSTITDGWEVTNINLVDTCTIDITAIEDAPDPNSTVTIIIANNSHIKNPLTSGTYNVSIVGSYEPYTTIDLPVVILGEGIPEATGTGSDTMSRLTVGEYSSHLISYQFNENPVENDTFTITFPAEFDCTGLSTDDVTTSTGWTVTSATPETCVVVVTAGATPSNPVEVTIISTNMKNPAVVEVYSILISGSGELITILVPIVDSDTININGFVTSNLYFDLDTGYGETPTPAADPTFVDCTSDACYTYGDSGNGVGPIASNYTVDLGNLTRDAINKSGQDRLHTDGIGFINSIYFDLSTNAASGVVVTYQSHYGEMRGPGHNVDANLDYDIPTTDGGTEIVAGTSGYGIQLATEPVYKSVGTGTQTVNCGDSSDRYCVMGVIDAGTGENTQLPEPIYTVTGPIELGRGKIDVAAAIDGTVVPGNYSDEVTFIATSTF